MIHAWLLLFAALAARLAACSDPRADHEAAGREGEGEGSRDPAASGTSSTAMLPAVPTTATPIGAPKPPMTKDEYAAFLKDEAAPLTTEAFETALLTVAACNFFKVGIDQNCRELSDYRVATSHKSTADRANGQIALKHLRHPAPSVRYLAVNTAALEAFSFDRTSENATKYFEAVRSEQDSAVLATLLGGLTPGARKDADVRDFALASLDHADPRVRTAAIRIVTDREVYAAAPLAFEKIVSATESDTDDKTRAAACAGLGETDDPRAVAPIHRLLRDAATPEEVLGGCFEGLVRTWTGAPYPKKPSKDGHDLTMKLL